MNSIKNTFVAVLLLGASYGVYQAITTPDTTVPADGDLFATVKLGESETGPNFESFPSVQSAPPTAQQLPPRLADNRSQAFSQTPASQGSGRGGAFQRDNKDNSFQPPARNFGGDQAVRQAIGNNFEPKANSIGVADSQKPHDHALISALKQVTGDTNTFQPPKQPANVGMKLDEQRLATPSVDDFEFMAKSKNLSTADLIALWPRIEQLADAGEFRTALGLLSRYYYSENVVGPQRQKLMGWLNALSGKVIYSSEHHFQGKPYLVRPNDTLEKLADNWKVPAGLIYNINRKNIPDRNQLTEGTELKIVVGPFNAEIDKANQTLTLFVKRMYAGQFNLKLSPSSLPNDIVRVSKKFSFRGSGLESSQFQIVLANGIKLVSEETASEGTASLSAREMQDLFVILSEESHVRIRD